MNDQINSMDTKQYCVLTPELLGTFFSEYLISPTNHYTNLEPEGFSLIKGLFKLVNEKEHKIQILNSAQAKKEHGTVSSACGSTLTSTTYSSNSSNKEFVVYVHPDQMKGIDTFWKIIMECTDLQVVAECIMFLDAIFHNVSDIIADQRMEIEEDLVKKCISKIEELRKVCHTNLSPEHDQEENIKRLFQYRKEYAMKQIERFFLHIRSFMDNSEAQGIGQILVSNALFSGEAITIIVNNKISWGPGCYNNKANPKKFVFCVNPGFTIWNIKQYLADKLNVDAILIKMEKIGISSKEFKDSENSKTLAELGIQNNDKFSIATKMASSLLDHMNLLFSDQTLTPEADRLFTEVFEMFTNEEGYMTRKTCTEFLQYCTNQVTDINDTRIKRLFDGYDTDKDDLVTCSDFKEFYKDSILKKESTVWANIRSWNYKQDLRKGHNRPPRSPKTLLRYLLPQKRQYFEYFLNLLHDEYQIAKNSNDLIIRLAVDPVLYEKVALLEDKDEEGNQKEFKFENMVDINNPFQLLYLLSLIIHFLEIKASTNTVHIVHNEDDFENQTDVNLKSPLMGNQLEVKGKAVSTGTSTQTNCDIPAPVPAVPIGVSGGGHRSNAKLGPVSLAQSQSSAGKASHVTSASTGGNVPMPPPLPLGVASVETLERQNNQVSFNTEDFDQEGKKYPPGGKFVEEPEEFKEHKTEKDKDDKDTKVYENYKEDLKMPNGYLDHIQTLSNEEWCLRFIQLGGFEFLFNLFMSENGFISKKFCNIESMTLEEKHCADAILNILSVIISSAQAANEATLMPSVEIIKETKAARQNDLPKVEEDQEMDDVNDDYEIDEAKLLQNVKEMQPTRVRTISAIAREEDHKEMQNMKKRLHESLDGNCSSLLKVLTGEYGDKILNEFPFENFINRVMTMMAYVLAKRSVTKEDKVILQKVGTLTSILFLFNEDLLEHFYNFYDSTTKIGLKELIIKGLTFSTDAEVKAVFSNLINFICTKIKQTNRVRLPIIVVLEILKQHFFESIKDATRFYGYKEFYEGFCHLIHLYFKIQDERNKKFENILEPEIFLKQIINILKNYKTKEKRNTVLEDHCLIGIFGILEQILSDKPEFLESIALDHGLLHEIFFDCLFQEAVDAPQIDVTPSFDLNSSK